MNTILVIEDQFDVRENIIELLNSENFNTLEAEDGFKGIQLAQENLPDLILCDIMMPEINGYDVLMKLRNNPETTLIPFIFLTAKVDMINIREGMNLGADDYLTKPFTRMELLQSISARLSKRKVFKKHTEDQIFGLQQCISYSTPEKILDPLTEIKKISEILIQDSSSVKAEDIVSLSQHIYNRSQFLGRSIQNFFLYMHVEFLLKNSDALYSIRRSNTMRPGDFIFMVAMQKAKEYKRSKDLKIKTENVPLNISTDDLKKIIEELLEFVISSTLPEKTIHIQTQTKDDFYQILIESKIERKDKHLAAVLTENDELSRNFLEEIDPALGVLVSNRIVKIYGGKFNLELDIFSQLTLTIALPIKIES